MNGGRHSSSHIDGRRMAMVGSNIRSSKVSGPRMNDQNDTEPNATEIYDWTTFEENEVVRWEGKPHIYSLIPAFIIGIPLAIIVIGIVIIAWAWVDRENTTYVITNRAVYRKRGAISRDVKRVSFEKIQNTSLKQGIFGTHFDYGNVEISTAGSEGAEVTFRAVLEPRSVQQRMNKYLEKIKEDGDRTEEERLNSEEQIVELLEEVRDELRLIRTAIAEQTDHES